MAPYTVGDEGGKKHTNTLGKSGEKLLLGGLSAAHENNKSRALFAERRAPGLHGQADTQTDVKAFVPYGTTSARHEEQLNHAENRPTK